MVYSPTYGQFQLATGFVAPQQTNGSNFVTTLLHYFVKFCIPLVEYTFVPEVYNVIFSVQHFNQPLIVLVFVALQAKLKKIKDKYADQDEDERRIKMEILAVRKKII